MIWQEMDCGEHFVDFYLILTFNSLFLFLPLSLSLSFGVTCMSHLYLGPQRSCHLHQPSYLCFVVLTYQKEVWFGDNIFQDSVLDLLDFLDLEDILFFICLRRNSRIFENRCPIEA